MIVAGIAALIFIIVKWKQVIVAFVGFMDIAANLWTIAWHAIRNVVMLVWNSIISSIEFGVNKIIDMINWLIRQVRRIPGVKKFFPGLKELGALDLSLDYRLQKSNTQPILLIPL